jgi:hypothetical protein
MKLVRYDFAVGLWNREDVDTTIQLIPGQTLLMLRVGVTRCTNIEKMLALYALLRAFVASKSCQLLFYPFPIAIGPLVAG